MNLRVINNTEISDDVIRVMLQQVAKGFTRQIREVKVNYTKTRILTVNDHVYNKTCGYRGHSDYRTRIIKAAFAKNGSGKYPMKHNDWRHEQFNFPVYETLNEEETCLVILAHEIEHLRRHLKGYKNTEQKVEKQVIKQLEKWRLTQKCPHAITAVQQ